LGLREWIIGPYAEEVNRLREEIQTLKSEVKALRFLVNDLQKTDVNTLKELIRIQKALENKADKKAMERELESLSKLVMAVYDKLKDLEAYSEVSLGESLDPESEEILVLDLIRQGYTSPSELVSRLKFGNKKLYAILKRLEAKGKLRKLRKKHRVHYVLVGE